MALIMALTVLGGCSNDSKDKKIQRDTGTDQKEGTEEGKKGSGRFFESECTLPKGTKKICSMGKLEDGSLGVLAMRNDNSYVILISSDQGKNWRQTKIKGLKKEFLPHAAIGPKGNAALFHYEKDGKIKASLADPSGKTRTVTLSIPGNQGNNAKNQVWQAAYSSQGSLIIRTTDDSLYKVGEDGTCTKAFDTKGAGINYFSIAGNRLVAIHDDGIMLFDTESGKALDSEAPLEELVKKDKRLASADTDSGQPMVFSEGTEKDGIMFANKEGIFHFKLGGSVAEQLMDGGLASLGSGNTIFYGIATLDQNNIFIAASSDSSGAGDKIYRYSYDKNAASAPDKELTVYALDESIFLRNAVTLFQKANPDIHVNLEVGLTGKDGVTLEDALSVLNTNILAGKGPDVLILDGMPVESYIQKGILQDITDVVEEVNKSDGFFPNILEASKQEGKIYAMPARLVIPILEGDQATVNSGRDLKSMAERVTALKKKGNSSGGKSLPIQGPESTLRDLFYADSATWLKEDGSLDKETVTDFLRYAKQFYDGDNHNSKLENQMDSHSMDATLETGEKLGSHRYDGLLTGEWKYSFGTLSDIYELQSICSYRPQTKTDFCLMNHDRIKSYIPYLMAGVVKSGNTDAGKKFVKLLLGKKAGNSDHNGIPVNRAAYDAVCKEKLHAQNVKDESSISFSAQGSDKSYGFAYANLKQEEIDSFTKIMESLEKPSITNRVIQKIILEQGKKYLQEEQGLEETADDILKKVNLYLAE